MQTAGKQIIATRAALDLVQVLTVFIPFSPKRTSSLENLKAQMSVGTPTIKALCLIRWTVHTRAEEAILSNYEVLLKLLIEVQNSGRDEHAMKAG